MGMRVFLAAAVILLSSSAFAQHAFTLEPSTAPEAKPGPATPPSVAPAPPPVIVQVPQPAPQATTPRELDVYVVPAATREVCTISNWGYGEIRRECRTEELPPPHGNPALRGICTTRYGLRTCY
jgi:hypothetical protein